MKIKINITKAPSSKSEDVLKKDIVDKLNNSIFSAKGFFCWEDDTLRAKSCSNVSLHNKLIILLSLFTDSNYISYGTFTSFNSLGYIGFLNYKNLEILVALDKFVDSIKCLNKIQIEVTNL